MTIHQGEGASAGHRERARQQALHDLQILDTPAEAEFDDLAWLAAQLCSVSIALVSLVDANRQWFKARYGLDVQQTARSVSFCAHTIEQDSLLEIVDALQDPRFADNPLVTGAPHIRFYAGAPLVTTDGHRLGTLCVIDTRPRELDATQREALQRLAARAAHNLEARRKRMRAESRERTLALLLEAMPDAVVTCDAAGLLEEFNKAARQWHGVDPRALPVQEWAQYFDLYEPDGRRLLASERIPLHRAWHGEQVREVEVVIRVKDLPPRWVLCNADPLFAGDGSRLGAVCVMRDVTGLRAAMDALQVETQRFAGAFSAAAQGMALVSLEGGWLEVNDATCEIFGYSRAELMAMDFQRLTHPQDLQTDLELVADLLHGRRSSYQMEKRYLHRDGRTIHAQLSVSLVRDAQGRALYFVSQIQDFSARHLAEQRLRESEQHLRTVADNMPALVAHVGADLRYRFVNRPYAQWFGLEPDALVGRPMSEILRPEHYASILPRLQQVLAGKPVAFDLDVVHGNGLRHMHATYIPDGPPVTSNADEPVRCAGFHLMVHDVTERIQLTRMLHERALTDELTGLPNRAAWNDELQRGVARAHRAGVAATVMFLDLDGFKQVNDTYGHAAGDALLCEFAHRLRGCLRRSDFIARLAGDEFVVLLDRITHPDVDPVVVARKVLAAMEPSAYVGEQALQLSPSIGIAAQREPVRDAARLMRAADEAMYQAKRSAEVRFAVLEC